MSEVESVVRLDGSRRERRKDLREEFLAQIEDWEPALDLAHRLVERVPHIIATLRDVAKSVGEPALVNLRCAPTCAATIRETAADIAAGGIE